LEDKCVNLWSLVDWWRTGGGLVGGRLFQTRWKGEKIGSLIERDFKGERWMKCQDPENQKEKKKKK
jgi:hypothetical protein